MDQITATASSTRNKFAPAGLLAGTAAAIIVIAAIIPGAAAFAAHAASPAAASGGSVSVKSGAKAASKVAPSTVVGWGIPASGARAGLSALAGKHIAGIAGAMDSTTFLTADGRLFLATSSGVTDISSKAVHPTAVAAGAYFTVVLNGDGTVSAWGEGFDNPRMVPAQINGVTAIAAGSTQVLALLSDGSIATFGSQPGSQIAVPAELSSVTTNSASTPATAIAAGTANYGAIVGGKVVVWGEDSGTPPAAMANASIVSLAAGDHTFLALSSDGRAFAWGAPYTPNSTLPDSIAGRTDIVQIASGNAHDLFLTKSGKVLASGVSGFGVRKVPSDLAPVQLIGAGRSSSWAVTGTMPPPSPAAATPSPANASASASSSSSSSASMAVPAPRSAPSPSIYAAVQKWADAAAAGNATARRLIKNTGQGTWLPGDSITSITIHNGLYDGPTTSTSGLTCLRADIVSASPKTLGGRSFVPWDISVDAGDTVVWARGYPVDSVPNCG